MRYSLPIIFLVGCVKALAPQDVTRLKDAQRDSLSNYQDPQATPLIRQRSRVAFCLVEASLKSANAETIDSKGAIECPNGR
jgi:PBP1b-binding outer membrane lipoprotein LpoB